MRSSVHSLVFLFACSPWVRRFPSIGGHPPQWPQLFSLASDKLTLPPFAPSGPEPVTLLCCGWSQGASPLPSVLLAHALGTVYSLTALQCPS